MKHFQQLTYVNSYSTLPEGFYSEQQPIAIDQPKLVISSSRCARWLNLDPATLASDESLRLLSGQSILEKWKPLAMKYVGHQFGYLNPDLGDGRGLLLTEVINDSNELIDLHLKGSGQTPYSRQGDGRAVLRSSIREFLCSEAMHALGIPTSRALAVVGSATPVMREQQESAATLLRVTRCHIRFGHFEYAYHAGGKTLLLRLSDYVIQRYFPRLKDTANQYNDLFIRICEKTAELIAQWQCIGFTHGVMNTDNMSILGETFDYGPFAFLNHFDAGFISNHSDHQGRYAFDRQPAIAHWNLSALAQAMSPIVEAPALQEGLQRFSQNFNDAYLAGMRAKLGLQCVEDQDQTLIFELLQLMQQNQLDYCGFFRQLSEGNRETLRNECVDISSFDHWYQQYLARLTKDGHAETRKKRMLAVNPLYILRNHLAQTAIEHAEHGDYTEVRRLHEVLQKPFEKQEGCDLYSAMPPEWSRDISISCSS